MTDRLVYFTQNYFCIIFPDLDLGNKEKNSRWISKIESWPERQCLWISNSFEKNSFCKFKTDEDVEKFMKEKEENNELHSEKLLL